MIIEAKKTGEELERINDQRRKWLVASSIVFFGIIFLIFTWDWLDQRNSSTLWWAIVSCMLIISINWWYWTMRVVRQLLSQQKIVFNLLSDIVEDIKSIKNNFKRTK